MANHVVPLTTDEEAALAEVAARAQDPAVTVDAVLRRFVHSGLQAIVQPFLDRQILQMQKILNGSDAQCHQDLYNALALALLKDQVTAIGTALSAYAVRLP